MLYNGAVNIPADLDDQFAIDPVFGFRKIDKPINGFNASFVHGFIAAEKIINKNEPVIDANRFSKVPDGFLLKHFTELGLGLL